MHDGSGWQQSLGKMAIAGQRRINALVQVSSDIYKNFEVAFCPCAGGIRFNTHP